MTVRSLRLFLLPAVLLVTLPVAADAPRGPTPENPNREPQYQAFVRDTPVINDNFTKLAWERFAARTSRTFAAADTNCAGAFAGRVPTVKELLTIVDEDPHQVYEFGKTVSKAIDQLAFGSYTGVDLPYWTSTPTGTPDEVWGVSFADGTMVRLNKTSGQAYARCVR